MIAAFLYLVNALSVERYKVERKFGEVKQRHGLGRCRYLGRMGFAVQALITAIILNLKRMVRLLTGVGFKTQTRASSWVNYV